MLTVVGGRDDDWLLFNYKSSHNKSMLFGAIAPGLTEARRKLHRQGLKSNRGVFIERPRTDSNDQTIDRCGMQLSD
jgi:hypothetical protein